MYSKMAHLRSAVDGTFKKFNRWRIFKVLVKSLSERLRMLSILLVLVFVFVENLRTMLRIDSDSYIHIQF